MINEEEKLNFGLFLEDAALAETLLEASSVLKSVQLGVGDILLLDASDLSPGFMKLNDITKFSK
jgi:hypothetical protein